MTRMTKNRRLVLMTGHRGRKRDWEWHNYNGVRYLAFGIASPTVHHWWAFYIWIYFTMGRKS